MLPKTPETMDESCLASPINAATGFTKGLIAGSLNAFFLTPTDIMGVCRRLKVPMNWQEAWRLPTKFYQITFANNLAGGLSFFLSKDMIQAYCNSMLGDGVASQGVAAAFAGIMQSLVTSPFSTIRVQMCQQPSLSIPQVWQNLPNTIARRMQMLYAGLTFNLLRTAYWPSYYIFNTAAEHAVTEKLNRQLSGIELFGLSTVTGMATSVMTYPLTVFSDQAKSLPSKGVISSWRMVACELAKGSMLGAAASMYRGFSPALIRMGGAAATNKTATLFSHLKTSPAASETHAHEVMAAHCHFNPSCAALL